MSPDLVGLAFAAGMVAALNPCGFAMLPAYLTLVVRRDTDGAAQALGRAAVATLAMTFGFVAVFGLFGVLTTALASAVARYLPYLTLVIGVVLVALGLWLVSGRALPVRTPTLRSRWAPTAQLSSMVGYGAGYAIASLSCTVGPFLAVTGSALRSGSQTGRIVVYLAYAAGFALVVGVLAIAVAQASSALIGKIRAALPYVNRFGGIIVVAVGLYVAYYGWFEMRLMGSGGAGSVANDPVIAAASRVQQALAGWVYRNGAWPWLIALGTLLAVGCLVGWRRWRRRQPRRPASSRTRASVR